MPDRTFGIKMKNSPEGPLVCFGRIKRNPKTLQLFMEELEGVPGAHGTIVGDEDLLESLERLMVIVPSKERSNECGPMYWPFKRAVTNAIQQQGF